MVHPVLILGFLLLLGGTLLAVTRPRGPVIWAVTIHLGTVLLLLFSAFMTGIFYDAPTYLGDLWTVFDAITKTAGGQSSSIDYFNPIGPVYEWIFAAALELRPASAATVPLAGALAGTLAVLAGAVMLRQRVSRPGMALALFATAAVAVSGRGLDALLPDITLDYLAPYNRWGWALLLPVTLRLATPSRGTDPLGALACGLAIAAMLGLKVTYGLAACGLVFAAMALRVERISDGIITLGTAAIALVVAEGLTGQILANFKDLSAAAGLPSAGLRQHIFARQGGEMMLAALSGLLFLALTWRGAGLSRRDALRASALLWLVAVMGSTVLMQNHYVTEAGIYCILPLIAVEWTRFLRRFQPIRDPAVAAVVVAVTFLTLRPAVIDAALLVTNQTKFMRSSPDPAFANTMLQDLRLHASNLPVDGTCFTSTCRDYTRMVGGLSLLRAAGAGDPEAGAVLALNFSNPFPSLLGKPSPRAAPIWLHADRSFSDQIFPAPEALFADVDFVMIARHEGNAEALARIYGDSLAQIFTPAAEDGAWQLLRRKRAD